MTSGATLLITSHDRRFLTAVANRFLWIHDGRMIEIPDAELFFDSAAAGVAAGTSAAQSSPVEDTRSPGMRGARMLLERIDLLEQKLRDDVARKEKFQKPGLQAQWRRELDELYLELEQEEQD